MQDYSSIGLNNLGFPKDAPIAQNDGYVSNIDFDSKYEDGIINTGKLAEQSITLSKISNIMPNLFGNGADGTVTISADTSLSGEVYYANLTIGTNVALNTNGWRVFCSGTIKNLGTIHNNGNNGSSFTGGTVTLIESIGLHTKGGNGANGVGHGTNAMDTIYDLAAGKGGNGGGIGTFTGGNGGTSSGGTTYGGINDFLSAVTFTRIKPTTVVTIAGGLGGGGGASNSAAGTGGGGGAGGGALALIARSINNSLGVIESNGGNGAAATGSGTAGGGGGGGGGPISLFYLDLIPGVERANAGIGGAGVNGGIAGSNGVAGTVYKFSAV